MMKMKIFDISQEVFDCAVFPGDPKPVRNRMMLIKKGDVCNLTGIEMCAHNGTHVDAPYHFIDEGRSIGEVPLEHYVGYASVFHHEGDVTESDAVGIINNANATQNTVKCTVNSSFFNPNVFNSLP